MGLTLWIGYEMFSKCSLEQKTLSTLELNLRGFLGKEQIMHRNKSCPTSFIETDLFFFVCVFFPTINFWEWKYLANLCLDPLLISENENLTLILL